MVYPLRLTWQGKPVCGAPMKEAGIPLVIGLVPHGAGCRMLRLYSFADPPAPRRTQ